MNGLRNKKSREQSLLFLFGFFLFRKKAGRLRAVPILLRSDAGQFFEDAGEVALIVKLQQPRDLSDRKIGLHQQHPLEESPGFRRAVLAPKPDYRLQWVKARVHTAAGLYQSEWSFDNEVKLTFRFKTPFNAEAQVRLPYANAAAVTLNGALLEASGAVWAQHGEETYLELDSGSYVIHYTPTKSYIKKLSTHTPLVELLYHEKAQKLIANLLPHGMELNPDTLQASIGEASLRDLSAYYPMEAARLDDLDEKLAALSIQ